MSKYQERAQRYHREIHHVLLEEWDPIGIKDIPEAQDEYDEYISAIYKMLISKKLPSELVEYLWWLETKHMGLKGNFSHTEEIAKRLLSLNVDS